MKKKKGMSRAEQEALGRAKRIAHRMCGMFFTRHAREMMADRNVSPSDVRRGLKTAEWAQDDSKNVPCHGDDPGVDAHGNEVRFETYKFGGGTDREGNPLDLAIIAEFDGDDSLVIVTVHTA